MPLCLTLSAHRTTSVVSEQLQFCAEMFPDKWKKSVLAQMDKKASGNDRQTVLQDRNVIHDQVFQLEHLGFLFSLQVFWKGGFSSSRKEMP